MRHGPKLTDVLMLRELLGPFAFGIALFTMLGMSITYLFAFTDYAVRGVPIGTLIEMSLMLLPGMLVKTLPASMLLAALLATGRMSGDSEATALFSVGASLWQVIRAVAFLGLITCVCTILLTESVVPPAAQRAFHLKYRVVEKLQQNPLRPAAFPLYSGQEIEYFVAARDGDFGKRTFWGCVVIKYSQDPKLDHRPELYAYAREVQYAGGTELLLFDLIAVRLLHDQKTSEVSRNPGMARFPIGTTSSKLDALFRTLETQDNRDPDAANMRDLLKKIDDLKKVGVAGEEQIRNLQMGFYNKIAFPVATLIFALVGAPLGIRQSRTSNALGFALALVIIFGYWMLSSYMAVLGQGGAIPPWMASFGANIIGLVFAILLLIRRSR